MLFPVIVVSLTRTVAEPFEWIPTLLFDVYHISGATRPRPRGWVDRPSEGILQTYGLMYTALSEAVRRTNPTIASRALVIADSIFKNTTLSSQPPGEVR